MFFDRNCDFYTEFDGFAWANVDQPDIPLQFGIPSTIQKGLLFVLYAFDFWQNKKNYQEKLCQ